MEANKPATTSIDRQTAILTECFNHLATAPYLAIHRERYDLAQTLIDTLGSYPRPHEKGSDTPVNNDLLGAYLYASTARNTLKLSQLGFIPFDNAFGIAGGCFEASLSLLTDNQ